MGCRLGPEDLVFFIRFEEGVHGILRPVLETLEAVLGLGLGRPRGWFSRAGHLCFLEFEDLHLKGLQGIVGEFAAST